MSEEKKLILTMLKEGKINEDEALKLLDAIGQKEESNSYDTDKNLEDTAKTFSSKITSGVNNFISKIEDALSNINIDDEGFSINFSPQYSSTIEKTNTIENLNADSEIEIINKNGRIELNGWDNDYIEIISKINYDEKYNDKNTEFLKIYNKNNKYFVEFNNSIEKFYMNILVNIPNNLKTIEATSSNGRIEIRNIITNNIGLKTSNSRIIACDVECENLFAKTSNARFILSDINADELNIATSNGKIIADTINAKDFTAKTSNSNINISSLSNRMKKADLKTSNATIKISDLDYSKPIKAEIGGSLNSYKLEKFNNIEKIAGKNQRIVYTKAYDENNPNDALLIKAHTSNGRIRFE